MGVQCPTLPGLHSKELQDPNSIGRSSPRCANISHESEWALPASAPLPQHRQQQQPVLPVQLQMVPSNPTNPHPRRLGGSPCHHSGHPPARARVDSKERLCHQTLRDRGSHLAALACLAPLWRNCGARPSLSRQGSLRLKLGRCPHRTRRRYNANLGYPGEGPPRPIQVLTINITGWGYFVRGLRGWVYEGYDIILLQETHLLPHRIAAARSEVRKAGYHSALSAAIPTQPQDGVSDTPCGGGVAILWPIWLASTG